MPHPPVLVPEVGQGRESECKETLKALELVGKAIEAIEPETIIVITPHGPVFSDGVAISGVNPMYGNLKTFGTPDIEKTKENDLELLNKIMLASGANGIVTAKVDDAFAESYGVPSELDHGVIVPLHFAEKYYEKAKLIHITYGLLSRPQLYLFGLSVKEAVEALDRKTVVIASGDLSHRLKDSGPYDFNPAGPKFDKQLLEILGDGDFLKMLQMTQEEVKDAGECGYRSLNILAGILDGDDIHSKVLSYEGPFGVGYGVVQFKSGNENPSRKQYKAVLSHHQSVIANIRSEEDTFVTLARKTINQFVKDGTRPDPYTDIPEEMKNETAGVFVSLKSHGGLRGCIGTIAPSTPSIAHEIIINAIKAATEDPRFSAVEPHELDDLIINVDILKPAEPIDSISELDPVRYGVIVTHDHKKRIVTSQHRRGRYCRRSSANSIEQSRHI